MSSFYTRENSNVEKLTLESFSLGDTDDVDHLVLGKDLLDGDLLFEMLTDKVDIDATATLSKISK